MLIHFLKKLFTCARTVTAALATTLILTGNVYAADEIDIDRANWSNDRNRLTVRGDKAPDRTTVTIRYGEKDDNGAVIGTTQSDGDGDWSFRISGNDLDPIPCEVTAQADGADDDDKEVRRAPDNCSNDGGGVPPVNVAPTANANGPYTAITGGSVSFSSAGSNDSDGSIVSYNWNFGDGNTSAAQNPGHAYAAAGTYTVNLTVTDNDGATGTDTTTAIIGDDQPPQIPNVSINSTSRNGVPGAPVSEQPLTGLSNYVLFSANDLGMHCGDFDTRISSVLPPFNVMHTQVIQRGSSPDILTPVDGIEVVYSASSNPTDPVLSGINSAGNGPVLSSMLADGSVYKTNFWDVAREAYDSFYPQGILPAFYPAGDDIVDLALPMPNVEQLFLGDGNLTAIQEEMPGRFGPYAINDPRVAKLFTIDQPFFTSFPFGYTSAGVDWFESAGIPLTAFDDFGRENPWPLMRVQAKAGGQTLASLDTVLPISGEANCGFCHNDISDGGNGAATTNMQGTVTLSIDDAANVPMEVSLEWAADINVLRLHDQKHGTSLITGTTQDDPAGTAPFTAVVCQTCHYTPALDLAQLGPLGPENDGPLVLNGVEVSPSIANGRDQIKHKSMSNVMHSHHATVTGVDGGALFPAMPPPVDASGNFRDPLAANDILQQTCYQCHPGKRTDCLRGAMATGGMLCQDCHGDMAQVGDDFTRNVSPTNPGAFELASDFFTNPDTPRVPWANEPSCGSCHTGDVMDNMHGAPGTVGDPQDGIRLMQAFLAQMPRQHRLCQATSVLLRTRFRRPLMVCLTPAQATLCCIG